MLRSRSFFDRLRSQVLFFTGSGSFSYKNRLKSSKKCFCLHIFTPAPTKKYRLRPAPAPQHWCLDKNMTGPPPNSFTLIPPQGYFHPPPNSNPSKTRLDTVCQSWQNGGKSQTWADLHGFEFCQQICPCPTQILGFEFDTPPATRHTFIHCQPSCRPALYFTRFRYLLNPWR